MNEQIELTAKSKQTHREEVDSSGVELGVEEFSKKEKSTQGHVEGAPPRKLHSPQMRISLPRHEILGEER